MEFSKEAFIFNFQNRLPPMKQEILPFVPSGSTSMVPLLPLPNGFHHRLPRNGFEYHEFHQIPPSLPPLRAEGALELSVRNIRPIKIFEDAELKMEIASHERINKDLLFNFELTNISHTRTYLPIYIDNSIYYAGNQKRQRQLPQSPYWILRACVKEDNGNSIELCPTCVKNQKPYPVLVRTAECNESTNAIIVSASITCSGNPSNSSRQLQVEFSLHEDGSELQVWRGLTTPFCVSHHRGKVGGVKRKSRSVEYVSQGAKKEKYNLTLHANLLSPSLESIPNKSDLHVTTKEILPHLLKLMGSDPSDEFLNERSLHWTIRFLDVFIKDYHHKIESTDLVPISEFMLNFITHRDNIWEFEVRKMDNASQLKRIKFLAEKSSDIVVKHNLRKPLTDNTSKVMDYLYDILNQFEVYSKHGFCTCTECTYSHLAFVVRSASKKIKRNDIIEALNNMAIPTKMHKKWHRSLNGIFDKKDCYFNWAVHISNTPIGEFSRKFYTGIDLKRGILQSTIKMTEFFQQDQDYVRFSLGYITAGAVFKMTLVLVEMEKYLVTIDPDSANYEVSTSLLKNQEEMVKVHKAIDTNNLLL